VASQRHQRISEIFQGACDLSPDQRAAYLDEACQGDAELRAEVESLLLHDGGGPLETGGGVPPAPGPAEPLSIPGYTILRLLGEGGMGRVYLAEEDALGRRVAVKIVSREYAANPASVQRFVREARTMATVEHPHIVRVYNFGEIDGRHYLIMEYVEGESLATRIRQAGRLDVDESLRILRETVDGLEAAWEHGIVHRDVKPANILLDTRDRVRVADFGIAKTTDVESDTGLTIVDQVLGTPDYVSPEQARGGLDLDFRSDIYSLGIVLYEMLAGETPFKGSTPISVVDQHIHTPLPAIRSLRADVPGKIEQLCEWMVRKRPADRPDSYESLGRNIDKLLEREVAPVPPVPPIPRGAPIFVGREEELERLDRALDEAIAGDGKVMFVTGDAGSGKTALIAEFARRAQERHADLVVAQGNCDAQTGAGDPYLPFREVLSLLTADVEFRRSSGEISQEHERRLRDLLPLAVETLVDHGPDLVGTFVSGEALVSRAAAFTPSSARWRVRLEELVRNIASTPRDVGLQQSYLFEQYSRSLQTMARKRPLLVQIEDLHWADLGSCSLLFHLGRRIPHDRVLLVGTYRPEEIDLDRGGARHPMGAVVHEFQRQFGDLEVEVGGRGTRAFVDALLDAEPNDLGDGFRERLFRQTQAHALFTVELMGSMRERDMLIRDDAGRWIETSTMDWETLPARVEGTIGERLDRLPDPLRRALTFASVQGEEFVAEVLARVQGTGTREAVDLLSGELDKRHRLVVPQGTRRLDGQRISTYRFRHNLFQKYLYGQMDETERAYVHEDVGHALETLYGERVEDVAGPLARHFQEAGLPEKTIGYLRMAGERATRLSANEEAIGHLRRALKVLEGMPASRDRDREELALQLALGPPLLGTAGPGSEDLSRAYLRAHELCDEVGTAPQLFQILYILVHHHANRGPVPTALEMAEQLLGVAERAEEQLPTIMAYWARGFALHFLGRPTEALRDFERVIHLYDRRTQSFLAFAFGLDPAVSSLSFGSVAHLYLGHVDRAIEYSRRAVALARDLEHSTSTAHALTVATSLGMARGETDLVASQTEELARLSGERGILLFLAWSTFAQGWIVTKEGRLEDGIEQMERGLAGLREAGSNLGHVWVLGALAEAHATAGRVEEALTLLSEASALVEDSGQRLDEAEIYRIRGETLIGRDRESAEAALRLAIECARRQEARWLELRATTSLGRLLRGSGRGEEARRMLADVYGWFREGLDTAELKEARVLLDDPA
jgi:tetratricopeptide (TPR) repeat protein/predicted Ser/Thr protein kinase